MTIEYDVLLSASAEQDLIDIFEHVRQAASDRAAGASLDDLLTSVSTLELHPARGAVPSELAPLGIADYRQIRVGRYRLIYRIFDRSVVVMVVADSRRDMQSLLERRLFGL
ncbi:MAG: type II toxin-antitoxin system RelE/ParE family toxin [Phenylobacterium sp.]|nr:type II toxin-antitoxin system RelE/ParE family toxin [Phenylobacterium sp.]